MIGLDIDKDQVRVVELKEGSEGITLTKFGVAKVIPKSSAENISHAISRTVAKLFAEQQIEEKEVYSAISGPRVQVRRMTLPPMPKEELSEAIKWEAKNFVPFSIETAAIDYYLLKEREGKGTKQELIVVAVDGEALKRHLEIIKGAGLKSAGVTPISFALWELAKFQPEFSTEELKGLVHIGAESTSLDLFKDHDLLFTREIDFSRASITETLAEEEHDPEEFRRVMFSVFGKLQNELISSLEYYREQFFEEKIAHLFLLGETAELKDLKEYLFANFGIPIDLVDPLKNLRLDPKIDQDKLNQAAQNLAIPIGLALGRSREINLLKVKAGKKDQGAEALKALEYVKIPNTAIIGTLALFVALIFGLNFYLNYSIGKIKKDLNSKTVKLSQLVKFRDRKQAFEDITKKDIDVKLLMARVNSLMPRGVTLAYLDFDNKKRGVTLGGESEDPKNASAFVKRVEESPYFRKTKLIEIKKVGKNTTFKMNFQIN